MASMHRCYFTVGFDVIAIGQGEEEEEDESAFDH